ncbi:MAG: hypothetical protein L0220_27395 [Acidobacteria bacterium]|nr:hypothetical protein [Acidobacteriota bacterium]
MKLRIVFFAASFVFAIMSVAFASDVTGKWIAQVPGRDGQTRETTINLKVEGDKLTGTVSGRQGDNPISDGTIKGDEISFSAQGGQAKFLYKGKVSGDEIKFTRTREGGISPRRNSLLSEPNKN